MPAAAKPSRRQERAAGFADLVEGRPATSSSTDPGSADDVNRTFQPLWAAIRPKAMARPVPTHDVQFHPLLRLQHRPLPHGEATYDGGSDSRCRLECTLAG